MSADYKRNNLWHKGLLILCVPLLFELVLVSSVWSLFSQSESKAGDIAESRQLLIEVGSLSTHLVQAASNVMAFCFTGGDNYRTDYNSDVALVQNALHEIKSFPPRPERARYLNALETQTATILKALAERSELKESGHLGFATVFSGMDELEQGFLSFKQAVTSLGQHERQQLGGQSLVQQQIVGFLKLVLILAVVVSILITALLAIYFYRQIVSRMAVLEENGRRIGSRSPLLPVMDGDDNFAQVDRTLHNAAASLSLAENEKQRMISMMGHDLRTPLTSVQITLALLSEGAYGDLDKDGVDRLQRAESNLGELINMISDFLDLQRSSGDAMKLRRETVDIKELVAGVTEKLADIGERKGVRLEVRGKPVSMRVDKTLLERALQNVIGNALKFTARDSTVAVSVNVGQDGALAVIEVADQGPGIAEADLEKIFEPYVQASVAPGSGAQPASTTAPVPAPGTTASTSPSTGLGLAIARKFIVLHGGTIEAHNNVPPPGACFVIKLPLQQQTDESHFGALTTG